MPEIGLIPSYIGSVLYKDEAIVLRTMRLGEADRIVTLFGRGGGKIRAVAKGVRKTKSRFGGRLEPFTHLKLVLWKSRSNLDIVTQADVIEPFRGVREDLDRFALGEVMLEAVDKLIQDREPSLRSFSLLVDSLHGLSSSGSPLVLAAFLLRVSGIAGFQPSLDRCAECGAGAAWFSPGQGGAVCAACRSGDAEEVGTGVLELMSDLTREGAWMNAGADSTRDAVRLARNYAEFHLERRFRSGPAPDALASLR